MRIGNLEERAHFRGFVNKSFHNGAKQPVHHLFSWTTRAIDANVMLAFTGN